MSDGKRPAISVILPTYNERENIIDLISEISLYLTNHTARPFEFILVDDDSPDRTWEIVEQHYAQDLSVNVIRRKEDKGLAKAIWRGIQEAKGEVVAWLDCDFSMPPHKLAELINKVYSGYDIAVGSRFIEGGVDVRGPADSWMAVFLSWMMNSFITLMLGSSFKDYTSGFVAAKKDVFEQITIKGDYGEYFIEFIYSARKKGYKIIEIPYFCLPRRNGSSKTGTNLLDFFKKGWKYISSTASLRLSGKE